MGPLQALVGLVSCSLATGIVLGVHNAGWEADVVSQLGVSAIRGIVSDDVLKNEKQRLAFLNKTAALKANGVDVFVSLVFNDHSGEARHRVPFGEDWDASMRLAEMFLRDVGSNIAGIVLGNEPTNDYSLENLVKNTTTGHMPALWWIRQLAKRVKQVRSETGRSYLVVAPDVGVRSGAVDRYPDGLPNGMANFIKQLMKMAEDEGLDAIDCHLHMANIRLLETAVAKVKSLTSLPLVALEWSQAPIVTLSGWLNEKQSGPFGRVTNLDFINQCYKTPVTEKQWTTFMEGHPYDSSFMVLAFEHMKKSGFLYATYGAAFQYGNSKFDSKQLIATKTVVNGHRALTPNEPLYTWFQKLVKMDSSITRHVVV